jgi:hypothetical protein
VGRGTLLAGGVIARDPVSGTKTNFSAGTKSIALVAAAEWLANLEIARSSPVNVKAFGAKGDSDFNASTGTDDTAAIQAALDHVNARGGGTVYIPEGFYKATGPLTGHPNVRLMGAGFAASYIVSTHAGGGGANAGESLANGSGIRTASPINGSTPIYFELRDLTIRNANPANVGAAYYDTGGTEISAQKVGFSGFKYGVVLDQSECVDIDHCEFSGQNAGGAGVWLVNGGDLTPGAASGYTNRISVGHCQINEGVTTFGIRDDGGVTHAFEQNNYNSCLNHIRAAGVLSLNIIGGEFEGAASHNIVLDSVTPGGASVGACYASVHGGSYTATAGNSAIHGQNSPGQLSVDGTAVFSGGGGTSSITGCSHFDTMWLLNYGNNTGNSAIRDGEAKFITFDFATASAELSIPGIFQLNSAGLMIGVNQVVGPRQAAIAGPSGGTTIDTQARTAITSIIAALHAHGLIG